MTSITDPSFLAAVEAPGRLLGSRIVMVDQRGNEVADMTGVGSATVMYQGESSECWSCEIVINDKSWVPRLPRDYLSGTSRYRAKIWWRIWWGGAWLEIALGVYHLAKPVIRTIDGSTTITVLGRDPISEAKRNDWAGAVLNVGGMTVSAALTAIFAKICPTLPTRVEVSTVTLPATMTLGAEKAWDNVTEIAAAGGMQVRTDRDGVIVAAPTPNPTTAKFTWQEGPDCSLLSVTREIDTDYKNKWIARSTNSELTAPISAVVECTDPGSPYWIGNGTYLGEIESDKINNVTAALNMARASYEQNLRPTETITVTLPQRPDLGYRDLANVAVDDAGVAGGYRVSSFQIWLMSGEQAPREMEVTFMTQGGQL